MMAALTETTERLVEKLFAPAEQGAVRQLLLTQCGNNLPFLEAATAEQLERFRFAALKISDGKLPALQRAVQVAREDWRDLLVAAGFGHDVTIHWKWAAEILGAQNQP